MLSEAAAARGLDSYPQTRQNARKAGSFTSYADTKGTGFGIVRVGARLPFGGLRRHATSPAALAANDPYEQTNRDTLKFNGKIDKYIVIPAVGVYFILVPEGGRRGAPNFLGNQGIQRSSVDYYSSLRSLYRQLRSDQIRNGRAQG
jgi:ABC-type transporter lipoprotein component MlaA